MVKVNPYLRELTRVFPVGDREYFLRLDMNENPEGLPQDFVEECFAKINGNFLARYPDINALLNTLSEYHGISKNCFCISDGSEMMMKYLFEGFVTPKSNIVTFAPTFAMYGVYARMFGALHREVPIDYDFVLPIEEMLSQIDKDTSMVVLLSPNNPVGGVPDEASVRRVIKAAREHDALVVIDEAYHYFCNVSYLKLTMEYDNVIVLRTFSKLFSLAACRVGYAVGNPALIDILYKARPTFDTNAVGLFFANEILQNKDLIQNLITTEREGREFLLTELRKLGYAPYDGKGNYVLWKPKLQPPEIAKLLQQEKILIKTYGNALLKGYIRVSTGSKSVMEKFLRMYQKIDGKDVHEK